MPNTISNALVGLTTSWLTDPSTFLQHHNQVKQAWAPFNQKRAMCHNFATNEPWDSTELQAFKKSKKTALRFHMLKSSERSMLGMFARQKMNIKFNPVDTGEHDYEMAELCNALYAREYTNLNLRTTDTDLLKKAWIGGNSAAYIWVETGADGNPIIRHRNLSGFQFFFDPRSILAGSREDSPFVDVRWRMSPEAILSMYPEHEAVIREVAMQAPNHTGFTHSPDVVGGMWDDEFVKDGQLLVIERFYRKPAIVESWVDKDGQLKPAKSLSESTIRELRTSGKLVQNFQEQLWKAVVVCGSGGAGSKFLENGLHYLQYVDPATNRVMFPVQELIDDHTEGVVEGHVEHLIDSVKTLNSLGSSMLHSARNSASQAKLADASAFVGGEKEFARFAREHTDPRAVFRVRTGFLDQTTRVVPHNNISSDIQNFMAIAKSMFEETSGTPPAFAGTENKTGISNSLNNSRLQQATLQVEVFVQNYRDFCRRRAVIFANIWKTFYVQPFVLRITGKENKAVNKAVWNPETQEVEILNDLATLRFDVTIDEGNDTFALRQMKVQTAMDILGSPVAQLDMGMALTAYNILVENADLSPEDKESAKEYSSLAMQIHTQKAQAELAKMQADAQIQQMQMQMQQMQMQGPTPPPSGPDAPMGQPSMEDQYMGEPPVDMLQEGGGY